MQRQIKWQYFYINFLAVFIPLCVFFGALLFFFYSSEMRQDKKLLAFQEKKQIDTQLEVVRGEYQNISSDLMVVSNLHELQKILNGNSHDTGDLNNDLQSISARKKMYDQIRYLDEKGSEVVRINFNDGTPSVVQPDHLQNKGQRYYFKDTFELDKNEIFISPLDLNIEQGKIEQPVKPMIRFGTPVFSDNGDKKGIVLLNYFGGLLINKLQNFPTDILYSQLSFLNPQGYWLKGPEPDEEWGFMYENRKDKTFGNKYPVAWQKISSTDSGQFYDETGLFTFVTFFPLTKYQVSSSGSNLPFAASKGQIKENEYFFKIVSHIPSSFLQKNADRIYENLLKLYLLIILVSFIGSLTFASFREKRLRSDVEREKMIRDLQKALAEIKTLQGIVPICAYCKKIRDDEGFWNMVESYIEKHTEAQFSHGICPQCVEKHFPGVLDDENKL